MTTFLLILAAMTLASVVGLVGAIRRDGLGERVPPASHEAWAAGPYASSPPGRH